MADQLLDVTGLDCPQPIVQAKEALQRLPAGSTLEILASDPGSIVDFQAFSHMSGNELMEFEEEDGFYRFILKKKA